ncbi:hypothetical protein JL722_13953 [Aureococcus anophagefferens]|nr:hypothetical protein JL722_13953 [Aureococcus anophagefferens]
MAALAWSRGALAAARAPHRALAVRFTQSSGRLSARRGEVQRRTGALAVKVGMLGTWDASGQRHALTPKHAPSAHAGHCGAHGGEAVAGTPYELARTLAEFRVSADAVLPPGRVPAAHFAPGQLVDVRGATRGKGFQGAMKRWNFGGQRATHGVSKTHRARLHGRLPEPGRVFKGKKMAGRMGQKPDGAEPHGAQDRHAGARAAVTGARAALEAPALARFGAEVDQSIHHAFVSGGAWHWAQLHNAPVADAFLQVANRKRWYFTVPDYAPFMRPICLGFTAGCRFMMDPRNQSRVPFVEIVTGPGDLLVFPSFWPHAVANLDEGFGFGVGVRPRVARELFAAAAFPATARRSQLSPALNFALRHAYTAATRPAFYRDAVARLSGKFASLSTSSPSTARSSAPSPSGAPRPPPLGADAPKARGRPTRSAPRRGPAPGSSATGPGADAP